MFSGAPCYIQILATPLPYDVIHRVVDKKTTKHADAVKKVFYWA